MKLLLIFLIFLNLLSCSQPLQKKTKLYELDVPIEKQQELTWCLPTSVLMCAEYFSNTVCWCFNDFKNSNSYERQKIFYSELKENDGLTFYPYSQQSAPTEISKLLYKYLNIANQEFAKLYTSIYFENITNLIKYEIKEHGMPIISITNEGINKTHAVVITGYQEIIESSKIDKVLYIDPYYGKKNKTLEEWKTYSTLNNELFLKLFFEDYYN